MGFLLVTLFSLAVQRISGQEFKILDNVRITNAVLFKKLDNNYIIYKQTIPMIYEERFQLQETAIEEHVNLAFPTDETCERCFVDNPNNRSACFTVRNDCPGNFQTIRHLTEATKLMVKKELEGTLYETLISLNTTTSTVRRKRELQFMGDFFRWCCGVATTLELEPMKENDEALAQMYQRMRQTVLYDHQALFDFHRQLDNLPTILTKVFRSLDENREELLHKEQFTILLRNQLNALLEHYKTISHHCTSSLIPPNVVSAKKLKEDLLELQTRLEKHNKTLVLDPRTKLMEYYRHKIARCQLTNETTTIALKIPITDKDSAFQVYEPLAIPFYDGGETCQVRTQKALLLYDARAKTSRILTGHALAMCTNPSRMCALTATLIDRNALCLKRNFEEAPLSKIKEACSFDCHKSHATLEMTPLINSISHREYIITQPGELLHVKHVNGSLTKVANYAKRPGAWHLILQCQEMLVQKRASGEELVLIDQQIPCFQEADTEAKITRILPAPWTTIHPASIIPKAIQSRAEFASSEQIFNSEWRNKIPFHSFETALEFEEKINSIVLKTVPKMYEERFYWDVSFVFFEIVATISLLTLAYLYWKIRTELDEITKGKIEKIVDDLLQSENKDGNTIEMGVQAVKVNENYHGKVYPKHFYPSVPESSFQS